MSCDRFDREGIEMLDRSEILGPHFSECADCRRALETHQKVVNGLGAMASAAPRENWQAGVWARIEKPRAEIVPLWSRQRVVGAVLAIAAAILIAVMVQPPGGGDPGLQISYREGAALRATGPKLDDVMIIRARSAAIVRVYFNESEVVLESNEAESSVVLKAAGRYRVVLFTAPVESTGSFDADVARALGADVEVLIEPPIDVL